MCRWLYSFNSIQIQRYVFSTLSCKLEFGVLLFDFWEFVEVGNLLICMWIVVWKRVGYSLMYFKNEENYIMHTRCSMKCVSDGYYAILQTLLSWCIPIELSGIWVTRYHKKGFVKNKIPKLHTRRHDMASSRHPTLATWPLHLPQQTTSDQL